MPEREEAADPKVGGNPFGSTVEHHWSNGAVTLEIVVDDEARKHFTVTYDGQPTEEVTVGRYNELVGLVVDHQRDSAESG